MRIRFPLLKDCLSVPTIARVLHHQLGLKLKKASKISLLATLESQYDFFSILSIFYSQYFLFTPRFEIHFLQWLFLRDKHIRIYYFPAQLLFIDECAVSSIDSQRRKTWAYVGSNEAVLPVREERGPNSISVLASFDVSGFVSWYAIPKAYDRESFHQAFCRAVLSVCNPYPLIRSILVVDNCRIHQYPLLFQCLAEIGCVLLYNAPRAPWLPIEKGFSIFKRLLRRTTSLSFDDIPYQAIDDCMLLSCNFENVGYSHFAACGYKLDGLDYSKLRDPRRWKPKPRTTHDAESLVVIEEKNEDSIHNGEKEMMDTETESSDSDDEQEPYQDSCED